MTLTEQWKKGELSEGRYYFRHNDNSTPFAWFGSKKVYDGYSNDEVKEVLAPVPSYEEWQAKDEENILLKAENIKLKKQSELDFQRADAREYELATKFNNLYTENQQLKTQIARLTEIVGVLPSNHSVGNLGYKIKNQRHEINNRLKEIDKLKELLKECREFFEEENPKDFTVMSERMDELLTKIDNAIGEKK